MKITVILCGDDGRHNHTRHITFNDAEFEESQLLAAHDVVSLVVRHLRGMIASYVGQRKIER